MKKSIFFIILFFLLHSSAYAATYYVDGSLGLDNNPGTIGSPWKTIDKANKTLAAGDTVYIRGGTYYIGNLVVDGGSVNSQGIRPSKSGLSGAIITYSSYPDEIVNFVGIEDGTRMRAVGVNLDGKSYIRVTGNSNYNMTFTNMIRNLGIGYNTPGHYNEIDHCDFGTFWVPEEINSSTINYRGSTVMRGSQYNYIHDNKFHDWQAYTTTWDGPVCLEIGIDNGTDPDTRYNVIENNLLYHCGHHCLGAHGMYNVFRGNIIHNEPYYDIGGTLYGYRNMISVGNSDRAGTNLLEGNKFGHTGISKLSEVSMQRGGSAISMASSYNIIRYNSFYGNLTMGLYVRAYPKLSNGHSEAFGNHIYNNTFYRGGYSNEDDAGYSDRFPIVFALYNQDDSGGAPPEGYHDAGDGNSVVADNIVKNNLFNSNWPQMTDEPFDPALPVGSGENKRPYTPLVVQTQFKYYGELEGQTVANNLEATGTADSIFVNADISNPMSTSAPDFGLKYRSAAMDAGSYLTQAIGSGSNSITLIVSDARYFQDGNFGLGALSWPTSVEIEADWIVIGMRNNIVQINSINYETNTITLASPMTWDDDAHIWLEKKSDGERVLYGTAPDMGAHELHYVMPPQNLGPR